MRIMWIIISIALAAVFTPAPAFAVTNSVVNVTVRCTIVNGSADNTSCVQTSISDVSAAGARTLYFPCGNYKTSGTLTIPAGYIRLQGEGRCSAINGSGSFNTISIVGGSVGDYGNVIEDLGFAEYNKTGGDVIYASKVDQFRLSNLFIDAPFCGPVLNDFNNVTVEKMFIFNITGSGCQAFLLTGGGTSNPSGRSDVIDFNDVVLSGHNSAQTGNYAGLIVDGFFNTISWHKLYLANVDSRAFWVRNSIGASHAPQFITIYGLEADFPTQTGVWLDAGSTFHFTDTQINGSYQNSNIYISHSVGRVSFEGGFSTSAHQAGIDIFGSSVTVSNMDFQYNS